ncbi:GDP-D-glucose phosphorylase 1 [Centruroides vittatus]|uniref:GDP-D-glucose phosphorylase 1 n=1 Tax=Centruroides vittatus TaxID=120091 RepID=UPI003510570F
MPLEFRYSDDDFYFEVDSSRKIDSKFDKMLKQKWEDAMDKGYFRYKLNFLESKILEGKYGFVAQLNVKRAVERRKPQMVSSIDMPFDPKLFNFTKVKEEEILFYVGRNNEDEEKSGSGNMIPHCLLINVSPLEYCNSLLVPYINSCLPQCITEGGLQLAVEIVLLSQNHNLKAGFNSLGAYASVNHFHFHIYYLSSNLYLETSREKYLCDSCYLISEYPAEGFAFQVTGIDCKKTVRMVNKLVQFLKDNGIAHNIFITRGSTFEEANEGITPVVYKAVRIYVWARKSSFGAKNDEAFNPALCELAGHLPIKNEKGFSRISESRVEDVLYQACHDTFLAVKGRVEELFSETS